MISFLVVRYSDACQNLRFRLQPKDTMLRRNKRPNTLISYAHMLSTASFIIKDK